MGVAEGPENPEVVQSAHIQVKIRFFDNATYALEDFPAVRGQVEAENADTPGIWADQG